MIFLSNVFLSLVILTVFLVFSFAIDFYIFNNRKATDKLFQSKALYYFLIMIVFSLIVRLLIILN
jgi:energy-coupling factor transporter transmembrane protein EcfT